MFHGKLQVKLILQKERGIHLWCLNQNKLNQNNIDRESKKFVEKMRKQEMNRWSYERGM